MKGQLLCIKGRDVAAVIHRLAQLTDFAVRRQQSEDQLDNDPDPNVGGRSISRATYPITTQKCENLEHHLTHDQRDCALFCPTNHKSRKLHPVACRGCFITFALNIQAKISTTMTHNAPYPTHFAVNDVLSARGFFSAIFYCYNGGSVLRHIRKTIPNGINLLATDPAPVMIRHHHHTA